jgi:cysteine desulfurase
MIYLDNHATTRCDPRVVEAMLPWFADDFGNPHSVSHHFGRTAGDAIESALTDVAEWLAAPVDSVVITSGATESNNLAIRGVCCHPRQKRRHIVTVTTEHPSVLDVVSDLEKDGFRVSRVPVGSTGIVDLERLGEAVDDDTAIVSVMWANNEVGAIAPMREIAEIAHARGALLHSDATQAVGRLPVDVVDAEIDLLSASAHKFYGPKGAGLLVVGNGNRRVRLRPQVIGGGQQHGLRSGTMNPAAVIGLATALRLCLDEMDQQIRESMSLRDRLWNCLSKEIDGLSLNGPALSSICRLPGNLNFALRGVEGEAWMTATPEVAFSSGSACSSIDARPSHVLTAMGLDESTARRSVRFGVGRFNSIKQIDDASNQLIQSYRRLQKLSV